MNLVLYKVHDQKLRLVAHEQPFAQIFDSAQYISKTTTYSSESLN